MVDSEHRIQIIGPLLVEWYGKNGRTLPWRQDRDAYKIWISEIMLQQTRIEAVKPYYARFMEELPDLPALAGIEEERLLKLWEGLGYYSRARNLKKCAMTVMEHHNGRLPADFEALKKLPGIGPYTAGAIASLAYRIPVPAVDGNVLRVLSRVLSSRDDISQTPVKRRMEKLLTENMPKEKPGEFNEGIMELGETVCIPNGRPLCESCPLKEVCLAHQQGIEEELPVKAAKKARRIEERTVLILLREKTPGTYQVGIRKRPDTGLLAGLYELPSREGFLSEEQLETVLREAGLLVREIRRAEKTRHIFSHVEWDMTGYVIFLGGSADPQDILFVEKDRLKEQYALPAAFRAFRKYFS